MANLPDRFPEVHDKYELPLTRRPNVAKLNITPCVLAFLVVCAVANGQAIGGTALYPLQGYAPSFPQTSIHNELTLRVGCIWTDAKSYGLGGQLDGGLGARDDGIFDLSLLHPLGGDPECSLSLRIFAAAATGSGWARRGPTAFAGSDSRLTTLQSELGVNVKINTSNTIGVALVAWTDAGGYKKLKLSRSIFAAPIIARVSESRFVPGLGLRFGGSHRVCTGDVENGVGRLDFKWSVQTKLEAESRGRLSLSAGILQFGDVAGTKLKLELPTVLAASLEYTLTPKVDIGLTMSASLWGDTRKNIHLDIGNLRLGGLVTPLNLPDLDIVTIPKDVYFIELAAKYHGSQNGASHRILAGVQLPAWNEKIEPLALGGKGIHIGYEYSRPVSSRLAIAIGARAIIYSENTIKRGRFDDFYDFPGGRPVSQRIKVNQIFAFLGITWRNSNSDAGR